MLFSSSDKPLEERLHYPFYFFLRIVLRFFYTVFLCVNLELGDHDFIIFDWLLIWSFHVCDTLELFFEIAVQFFVHVVDCFDLLRNTYFGIMIQLFYLLLPTFKSENTIVLITIKVFLIFIKLKPYCTMRHFEKIFLLRLIIIINQGEWPNIWVKKRFAKFWSHIVTWT